MKTFEIRMRVALPRDLTPGEVAAEIERALSDGARHEDIDLIEMAVEEETKAGGTANAVRKALERIVDTAGAIDLHGKKDHLLRALQLDADHARAVLDEEAK